MDKKSPADIFADRMKAIKAELNKVATPLLNYNGGKYSTCALVGTKVKLSAQGVVNYVKGTGGNGYMYESLIQEFKKLKK